MPSKMKGANGHGGERDLLKSNEKNRRLCCVVI